MLALNYRKKGMTEEEFHKYWTGDHYKVFSSTQIAKQNLLKYEQVGSTQTCRVIPLMIMLRSILE